MTKGAFSQRRKTIYNNYQNLFENGKEQKETIMQWLERADIDPKRRGETLSIQEYARLYAELENFPNLSL